MIRELVNLPKWFDAKFGVNNSSKCDIYKFAVGELTGCESSTPRVDQSAT